MIDQLIYEISNECFVSKINHNYSYQQMINFDKIFDNIEQMPFSLLVDKTNNSFYMQVSTNMSVSMTITYLLATYLAWKIMMRKSVKVIILLVHFGTCNCLFQPKAAPSICRTLRDGYDRKLLAYLMQLLCNVCTICNQNQYLVFKLCFKQNSVSIAVMYQTR